MRNERILLASLDGVTDNKKSVNIRIIAQRLLCKKPDVDKVDESVWLAHFERVVLASPAVSRLDFSLAFVPGAAKNVGADEPNSNHSDILS